MLDPTLDDDRVRSLIDHLAGEDGEMGQNADFVWEALTAGEGPAMVTQASLQNWLWWLLPKRSAGEHRHWEAVVEAATVLFTRLGARRYAEICAGDTTRRVLAAWRRSSRRGVSAARTAMDRSGVEPADLDDFVWGETFSTWEMQARDAVERALEAAIVEGRLEPGARGWRRIARTVTAGVIDTGDPLQVGQSWRSLVATERAERWVGAGSTGRERVERSAMVRRFLAPPPPPGEEEIAAVLAPLAWLADRGVGGLTLTAAGYLPPALVTDGVARFGWWDRNEPPQREADVPQFEILRSLAEDLGVVRRRGRTVTTTRAGRSLIDDPAGWWPAFARSLGGDGEYPHGVAETLAMTLLDGATHGWHELFDSACRTLAGQRWRNRSGPVDAEGHRWMVGETLYRWQAWGLTASSRDHARPRTTLALTPTGRAALAHWLHTRITGPDPAS